MAVCLRESRCRFLAAGGPVEIARRFPHGDGVAFDGRILKKRREARSTCGYALKGALGDFHGIAG